MSYIEREAILKHTTSVEVGAFSEWDVVKVEHIKNAPAADVVEVVHGEWIRPTMINGRTFDIPHCSACGDVPCDTKNYCSNCGAKMDGNNSK